MNAHCTRQKSHEVAPDVRYNRVKERSGVVSDGIITARIGVEPVNH